MNFKRFRTQVPTEYQELTFISNNGTQYIDTGLKGSDLADCELEIVMRNDTTSLTSYNFNGTYLSGSTAQFGLVATSNSECRSSMNFGFADAISTTGLSLSEFHTIYATNGLQKVDNIVVGTLNFGTLNNGSFLLFARTDPNQTSGVNICVAMSLKSFTVKRNNQYIRNMIPAKRKSDNTFGLYDTANGVFYTNQGTGYFTGGTVVEPTWHDIPYYIHNTSTDTITTLPADIYANDTTATVGLKGDMSQTGTPSPTTPIQPQECGERTGNLVDKADFTVAANDGSKNEVIYNGELDAGTYTVSLNQDNAITGSIRNTFRATIDGTTIYENASNNYHNNAGQHRFTFTVSIKQTVDIRFWANTLNDACTYSQIMLNTGSTPQPYEPYGYKIPISSANTTTPVYLGEVETTRKIKKYEFTGNETFSEYDTTYSRFGFALSDSLVIGVRRSPMLCTHFQGIYDGRALANVPDNSVYSGSNYSQWYIKTTDYTDTTTFKAYLQQQYAAGTPVTVWYILATPQTAVVNEPIRKIGDYADTVSGISVPTITGADSFDVLTTLKPSEVSLAYTGWHDATVKEWDGSEWQ